MTNKPIDVALAIELIMIAAQFSGSTFENTEACFDALAWDDERTKPTWSELQLAWASSKWALYSAEDFEVEEAWRTTEMPVALENVTAVQFGDPDVPGTEAQWKAYWVALRNWKDGNPDYPDVSKRPPRPD